MHIKRGFWGIHNGSQSQSLRKGTRVVLASSNKRHLYCVLHTSTLFRSYKIISSGVVYGNFFIKFKKVKTWPEQCFSQCVPKNTGVLRCFMQSGFWDRIYFLHSHFRVSLEGWHLLTNAKILQLPDREVGCEGAVNDYSDKWNQTSQNQSRALQN